MTNEMYERFCRELVILMIAVVFGGWRGFIGMFLVLLFWNIFAGNNRT